MFLVCMRNVANKCARSPRRDSLHYWPECDCHSLCPSVIRIADCCLEWTTVTRQYYHSLNFLIKVFFCISISCSYSWYKMHTLILLFHHKLPVLFSTDHLCFHNKLGYSNDCVVLFRSKHQMIPSS